MTRARVYNAAMISVDTHQPVTQDTRQLTTRRGLAISILSYEIIITDRVGIGGRMQAPPSLRQSVRPSVCFHSNLTFETSELCPSSSGSSTSSLEGGSGGRPPTGGRASMPPSPLEPPLSLTFYV